MNHDTGKFGWRNLLFEALLVVFAGAAFGLIANMISPRGLRLQRNYFPQAVVRSVPLLTSHSEPTKLSFGTNITELVNARLKLKGLQLIQLNAVTNLFRDPRYEQELLLFIDARKDEEYQQGHVPGAYQLDHYRYENYLATVLPACQTAEQVVVYCNGGGCEDSEFAATLLSEAGIPRERLFIYGGGMTEWMAQHLPVELGRRKSGEFRANTP